MLVMLNVMMIPECGVDSTLRSDSVTSRGEELCDAGSVEASLCKTKGSAETGTTSTNDNCIVLMVYHRILVRYVWLQTPVSRGTRGGIQTDASLARRGYEQD
jgi:hypothetical protein